MLRSLAAATLFILVSLPAWAGPPMYGGPGGPYVRHVQIPALIAGNITNQPTNDSVATAGCLNFDTGPTEEYAFFQFEIGEEWVGAEDMYLEVDWVPTTAMTGTDAVKWELTYRCLAEGTVLTAGTVVTVSATTIGAVTQDTEVHSLVTLDWDSADQPIFHEAHCFVRVERDTSVANDFAGDACVTAFEWIYTAEGFAEVN